MWLRRIVYRLGFRPSRGVLFSPSLSMEYAGRAAMDELLIEAKVCVPHHCGLGPDGSCQTIPGVGMAPTVAQTPSPDLPSGIDPEVWEVVPTYAEWVEVPTESAGCVGGVYLRRTTERDVILSDPLAPAATPPTTAEQAWEALKADHPEAEQKWVFLAGFDAGERGEP